MKRAIVLAMAWVAVVCTSPITARHAPDGKDLLHKQRRVATSSLLGMDGSPDTQDLFNIAQAETVFLGNWTFDQGPMCVREGWISVDLTEQTGCYWHVADATELNGGDFGGLIVLSGLQSLWCGASPDPNDVYLCGYASLPGYGNDWDQSWCSKCICVPDTEEVYICYDVIWDSEPGYDYTYVEYATKGACDSLGSIDNIPANDWVKIAAYYGVGGPTTVCDTIPAGHDSHIKIRFHFVSDGAWSDEDGLWNTDGAIIIDDLSLTAQYAGLYDFEDFEYNAGEGGENPGDIQTADGDWECCVLTGYGDFAGLYPGLYVLQQDPCTLDLTCLWAFINGTDADYGCGGQPGQDAVPYVNARGQYIHNEIWSPQVPWTGTGAGAELVFDVYTDNPLANLVFYTWHVRSIDASGCPGQWKDRNFLYNGSGTGWTRSIEPIGDLIEPTAASAQVALGVVDMCGYWCNIYGTGACHSHAPLFDNVKLYRLNTVGPQWSVRYIDGLFQDNFSADGTTTGPARADAAIDILPYDNPNILPGDSIVVTVTDPVEGLAQDDHTGWGPAVYCYVSVELLDSTMTAPFGLQLQAPEMRDGQLRYPLVDSLVMDGRLWYKFRMDSVVTVAGTVVEHKFCFDLSEIALLPCFRIRYFYLSVSAVTRTTTIVVRHYVNGKLKSVLVQSTTEIEIVIEKHYIEFEILPHRGREILYVDDADDRDGPPQWYFDSVFEFLNIKLLVDRYDVLAPSSNAGNSPGGRVVNVFQQLIQHYRIIIWNTGNLRNGTLGDGSGNPEKADDWGLLFLFMDQHIEETGVGIYLTGNNLAEEWVELINYAIVFRSVYMPFVLVTGNHIPLFGISPLIISGLLGQIFNPQNPARFVGAGGCNEITLPNYDCIDPTLKSKTEDKYSSGGDKHAFQLDDNDGAVLSCDTTNALGNPARVVLSGFSFDAIRDDIPAGIPDRVDHLCDILRWFGLIIDDPTGTTEVPQYVNSLAQNFPNPFNPSTTIRYSIRERGHVTLKIYNVAGQLVTTLVNDQMNPGEYTVQWDGLNGVGNPVASGVYFYRLVTEDFMDAKKMVIMK
jgi:hypothetical protein